MVCKQIDIIQPNGAYRAPPHFRAGPYPREINATKYPFRLLKLAHGKKFIVRERPIGRAENTRSAVETVTKNLPLGRMGRPDGTTGEIAEAVLFLASDRASFITGQTLRANGGGVTA